LLGAPVCASAPCSLGTRRCHRRILSLFLVEDDLLG
jgi:hypothetical protein